MWLSVGLIAAVLFVAIFLKYVVGTSGPSPFAMDTREPPKPVELDKKERNKVLKQGESVFGAGLRCSLTCSFVPVLSQELGLLGF